MGKAFPNRAPLVSTPFHELPLGSIKPEGWLRNQLVIQAGGLSGHLDEFWSHVGPNSGWLGGTGESWERGPYYLDGLLPLAYLLEDEKLIAKVRPWIEWTLSSQQEKGQFGPASNEDWWSRMIMLKVLIQYAECTGDERIEPFLTNYFRFQWNQLASRPLKEWAKARGGENLVSIQWLYNRTGEPFLLELSELIHEQTLDWTGLYDQYPYWNRQTAFDHRVHVVNVAMSFKQPALYYLHSRNEKHRDAAYKGIGSVMTFHGQVNGMFSGDEWLAGTDPSQGTELCAVVEYMFTLENLIRIVGDGYFGDLLEKVAFNSLPAAISPDWTGHQYDQQVNQIMCTHAKRNWTENNNDANLFGIEPHFGCCTANMHQGWPKLAARLWMATEDGGLAAITYAPCIVQSTVGGGTEVSLEVRTEYPFKETVSVMVNLTDQAVFPIKLRIPEWCVSPVVQINGERVNVIVERGFASLLREWNDGDVLALELPMRIRVQHRANSAIGLQRGPLVFAIPIKEQWQKHRTYEPYHDWELYPGTPWNYGLSMDVRNPDESFMIETDDISDQPFAAMQAPVRIKGFGRRIPQWTMEMNSAGTPPIGPVVSGEHEETITLLPYGCARLRIAEFPIIANSSIDQASKVVEGGL